MEGKGIDFINANLDDDHMVIDICDALEGDNLAFIMPYYDFVEQLKEVRQSIIDIREAERLMKEQIELMKKMHGDD